MTTKPCPSCVETRRKTIEEVADWVDDLWSQLSGNAIRAHFLPKTPAQELAEQCPHTDKADVIAWMLEREKATVEICDQCCGSGEGVADTVCTKCDGSGGQKTSPTDPAPTAYSEISDTYIDAMQAHVDAQKPEGFTLTPIDPSLRKHNIPHSDGSRECHPVDWTETPLYSADQIAAMQEEITHLRAKCEALEADRGKS